MGYQGRKAELTAEQATDLLSSLARVCVVDVRQIAFTNDVFRVTTQSHGTYYVKFHTARWYLDLEDTRDVVEHELAGYNLLQKRGFALPYRMWSDCSRRFVPQSVLICEQLQGHSALPLIEKYPELLTPVTRSVAGYLRRIHDIEFTNVCPLDPMHAQIARASGRIPYCNPFRGTQWDFEAIDPTEKFQRETFEKLGRAAQTGYIPPSAVRALETLIAGAAQAVAPNYASPRLRLMNVHLNHFHVDPQRPDCPVLGLYDFEGVAADDPYGDILEIELGLTTASRSFDWRQAFIEGYGPLTHFTNYKIRLLRGLFGFLPDWETREYYQSPVPDRDWLAERWHCLASAETWDDLVWYPTDQLTGKP